jgi:2-dehydropantoate 2-reductase
MRIAMVGAGAVGSYFGGKLAQGGSEVVFLARGENLEALRRGPLRVESIAGDFEIKVRATDAPEAAGVAEVIFMAVKTWQVTAAAELLTPMLGTDSVVIPLENGVEAPSQIASVVGWEHVAGGLCKIIAYMAGPGHVRHVGAEPLVAFGELSFNGQGQRLEKVRLEFMRARVTCEIAADITTAMWEKFIFIASISGIGAVTRLPIGAIRSARVLRARLVRAIDEMIEVGRAHGVALPSDIADKTLSYIDSLPNDGTSSMQRDIAAGVPSELEAQNGAVVRLGRAAGVPTPVHDEIYAALQPLETRARTDV